MLEIDPINRAIPTNIITGFLGAGKTSAILHLLEQKPGDEHWAVLVNEFGEIGIDGGLFQGQHSEEHGVFIREVPGGCMCCSAGIPMQFALNELLTRARPDRLLIEPTGLGHPVEVLEILAGADYRAVLSVQKVVTLVDARKVTDIRYTEHPTFKQQLSIADIVVGNKVDLYREGEKDHLLVYTKKHSKPNTKVVFTEYGILNPEWLRGDTSAHVNEHPHQHDSMGVSMLNDASIPTCGYVCAKNHGEGFTSIGWRFKASMLFNHKRLYAFLSGLTSERMKAVFATDSGVFGYNLTADALTELKLEGCVESRIEIIGSDIDDEWESQLLACIDNVDS